MAVVAAVAVLTRIEGAVPGNALERAVATSTLVLLGRQPDIGPLLTDQLPSGAWPTVGFYHMGHRNRDEPPIPPWWGSEALTTVLAVEALSLHLCRCEAAPD